VPPKEKKPLKPLFYAAVILFWIASAGWAHAASASPAASPAAEKAASPSEQSPKVKVAPEFLDDDLSFLKDEKPSTAATVPDPLISWNRVMFQFNDKLYFWVLKPVAKGYRAVFPEPVRTGVKNFFFNLTTPIRFASCLLQGKLGPAGRELGRFFINSSVGVLGLGNPAKAFPKFNPPEEDLGQTLGVYGLGNGIYIVWPVLGPSTLRDSVGLAGDYFLDPVSYVTPWWDATAIDGVKTINATSFRIGDYEALKSAALDPYEALRDAYIQNRRTLVRQ
jgi:phospholipid-binding lipoprotein MlaA